MDIEIRPESSADWVTIDAVTAAAFVHAPHTNHRERQIVDGLRKAGALAISLVAETAGTVIGHVAISPVTVSDGATGWFGLGPLSVLPPYQRQGVGSRLVREALRLLRERGAAGCVVLGEPAYYGRFGFRTEPRLILPGVPPEYFQVLTLDSSQPQGSVKYAEAFSV
jgi:putative acetyltransferase